MLKITSSPKMRIYTVFRMLSYLVPDFSFIEFFSVPANQQNVFCSRELQTRTAESFSTISLAFCSFRLLRFALKLCVQKTVNPNIKKITVSFFVFSFSISLA